MKLFPSERARQQSDRRTVRVFFTVISIVALTFAAVVFIHRLLGA